MQAKEFLQQLEKLDKMIENKQAEVQQWKVIAANTVAHSEGERVQSSGSKQKMADAVDRYIDLEREINACIDNLIDTKKDVISVIERLKPDEYDVLHKIYVQYFTLKETAYKCGISYTNVTTIHGRALLNVQKILDLRKRDGNDMS